MAKDKFPRHFVLDSQNYRYNRVPFNNVGERAVEVPIALDFLASFAPSARLCEVGNVLSNYEEAWQSYFEIRTRQIIDKYEVAAGVDNLDILEMPDHEAYDGIISVSTMEHVGQQWIRGGYSGEDRDFEAPLKAIAKVYDLLRPGGRALITVPFGRLLDGGWYIQFSAEYLKLLTDKYGISSECMDVSYLRRDAIELTLDNPRQHWVQVQEQDLVEAEYDIGFPHANGIAIIRLTKTEKRMRTENSTTTSLAFALSPIIGSVFSYVCNRHVIPDASGYFYPQTTGPVISLSVSKPPAGSYDLTFGFEMKKRCELSLQAHAFPMAEDSASAYKLLDGHISESTALQMRVTLPAGLERVELMVSNYSGAQARFRILNFVIREVPLVGRDLFVRSMPICAVDA
jgi:SAM-dependent methyltransferase